MNHQTFENWILDAAPLSEAETQALRAHLETCESCRALAESWGAVAALFDGTPAPDPAPGFSDRWLDALERAEAAQHARARRQAWIAAAVFGSGALLTLILLGVQFVRLYGSFWGFALDALSRTTGLLVWLVGLGSLGGTFLRAFAGLVPLPVWGAVAAFSGLAMLLWVVVMAKIVNAGRGAAVASVPASR